ncbi:MAG: hypothetical protein BA872_01295 [Desulfobacterales bacterium C00003060]|nr:MAG: hypothetical protein BA872_01295 [Desulfobacterales bacterium C00003060]OEU81055.1 MAG: hypothetical protein BA865_12260 [Desulfobacterales bacterium S5133MH4]
MIPKAESITHLHLLSIVNTEIRKTKKPLIRILDVGCGNGHLIAYMTQALVSLCPSTEFEIYGLDVNDSSVQSENYCLKTNKLLSEKYPEVSWNERITIITSHDRFPFVEGFFDVILSNQVLEHVHNHDLFFSEISRTLKEGGVAAHLYPLRHYFYEGHLHLPLVHKILNYDILYSYIKCLSRLGLGKFKLHKKTTGISLAEYTKAHADYMYFNTNYLSYTETLNLSKKYSLRGSFKYTQEFYGNKLRSLLRLKPKYAYKTKRASLFGWVAIYVLKYLSSVTLFLEKENTYRKYSQADKK